ncbi:Oidioi.mRNA.OKI2018_I69.XSR.g15002.t1.cds [Oikopleura dioica]|uniref:Oidioi.mRNA.OKI2018_I69.XSR.g15002.t1.cds n=1 Tax=Oikopleura dioica TaxID=34765 RepID=A0ABN7SBY0_OIKDI|nr:Oidioi.mRNA.OKI2018_I69.XSR.g15002.t1.cds [Oikopleura dioica]
MSDDDYDDRRRDKFRTEREGRGRERYDDDGGSRRDRYGRDREYDRHEDRREREKRRRTPDREFSERGGERYKRPRHDYDDSGERGGGYRGHRSWNGPGSNGAPYVPRHVQNNHYHMQNEDDILLSFKNWVMKQEDNINEDDACKNYKVYKTEFKKKQMQEFFVAHKDEEWFREKYHPDAAVEREEQFKEAVKLRCEAWEKLTGVDKIFDENCLDITNEKNIIDLLETAVMLMEGASEDDIKTIRTPIVKSETDGPPSEGEKADEEDDDEKKGRGKFDRGEDGSDDESEKNDAKKEEEETKEDEEGSKDAVSVKTDPDAAPEKPETSEDGEVNDPSDKLEAKRKEALKRAQTHTKYSSIFMRSLPPSISRQDISNMCKKFDGFIRVAFSHPQDDRFYRRCWVTFDSSVNIKDICWNLNNVRLKEVELNPVVNRDLTRRCRPMSSLANHNTIMKADILNLMSLIKKFDEKYELYTGKQPNPVILKTEDYLEKNPVEDDPKNADEIHLNYDKKLAQIADILTLYLRLVHSVDYYNHSEYRNEDEMPNRCGIIHVRGEPPSNPIMPFEMNDYVKKFLEKCNGMLTEGTKLDEEEIKKLGMKDEEEEIKKFIEANTQQLGPEKYLCPLSGKKFKGPEFVKKHILIKHAEKVEAVRNEVKFFNRYLADPKRPNDPVQTIQPFRPPPGHMPPGHMPMRHHQVRQNNYNNTSQHHQSHEHPDRRDSYTNRPVASYKDLDAPEDVEIF